MSDDGKFGFSIIAMIGSVFSPYYAWSGRKNPNNHVALNVGLYGGGKKRWTMTERGEKDLIQEARNLTIGPSSLSWSGDTLTIQIQEWANPIWRKVSGIIKLQLPGINPDAIQLDHAGKHFWQPISAVARAEVAFDSPNLSWTGDAYMDSNWGSEPLEVGFRNWDWSRAHTKNGAGILYDAFTRDGQNKQLALEMDRDGNVSHKEIPQRQMLKPGPIWRVPRSTLADETTAPSTIQMLEDTPFYTRSHIQTSFMGEPVRAVHESLDCNRFASNWVRCLLPFRMPRVIRR